MNHTMNLNVHINLNTETHSKFSGDTWLREREVITYLTIILKTEYRNLILKIPITGYKYAQYAFGFEISFNLAVVLLGIYLTEYWHKCWRMFVVAKIRNNQSLINR